MLQLVQVYGKARLVDRSGEPLNSGSVGYVLKVERDKGTVTIGTRPPK